MEAHDTARGIAFGHLTTHEPAAFSDALRRAASMATYLGTPAHIVRSLSTTRRWLVVTDTPAVVERHRVLRTINPKDAPAILDKTREHFERVTERRKATKRAA